MLIQLIGFFDNSPFSSWDAVVSPTNPYYIEANKQEDMWEYVFQRDMALASAISEFGHANAPQYAHL